MIDYQKCSLLSNTFEAHSYFEIYFEKHFNLENVIRSFVSSKLLKWLPLLWNTKDYYASQKFLSCLILKFLSNCFLLLDAIRHGWTLQFFNMKKSSIFLCNFTFKSILLKSRHYKNEILHLHIQKKIYFHNL